MKEYDTLGRLMVYSDHQLVITLDHEFLPYGARWWMASWWPWS